VDVLIERFPQSSKQTLKRMVEQGRVRINGVRARRLTDEVKPHDELRVEDRPRRQDTVSLDPLEKIFEDQDLLIVNKPAGLLTSTGPREKRPTALAIIQNFYKIKEPRTKIGLIHRLDREASGLLVFSKSDVAYESLKTQFFRHDVQRVYHAIVKGNVAPPAGTIESLLVEYADGTVHSTRVAGKGQRAVTHYDTVRQKAPYSELRVRLETGRKHQIRVHLAGRNWPIVGDRVYGKVPAERLMLSAIELGFTHPRTGAPVHFAAPIPEEMSKLMS
jgi:23S rRNA pseudouridine1911/1915/1917 synthase